VEVYVLQTTDRQDQESCSVYAHLPRAKIVAQKWLETNELEDAKERLGPIEWEDAQFWSRPTLEYRGKIEEQINDAVEVSPSINARSSRPCTMTQKPRSSCR
jgi:hypothetical protein